MSDTTQPLTAHDLAASWEAWDGASGFRVGRGQAVWETAEYPEGSMMNRVRIRRLEGTSAGPRTFTRYIDPDTKVTLDDPRCPDCNGKGTIPERAQGPS